VARAFRRVRRAPPAGGSGLTEETSRSGTILQGGRRKAYRPLPPDRRRAALEAGLAAYERGNFFEAHELLEPAWMGTSDLAERSLYQGLIKLAAGYVHAVRGNPVGMTRNLYGARKYLEVSLRAGPEHGLRAGIDLPSLLVEIDKRLEAATALPSLVNSIPAAMLDLAEEAPPIR
jgi:predicted metal-dependent hydrolase